MVKHKNQKTTGNFQLIGLACSILIGGMLYTFFAYSTKDFKPEDFGLGKNTSSHFEYIDDIMISEISTLDILHNSFKELGGSQNIVLWAGASQLHSINNFKKGNRLAVSYANNSAIKRNSELRYLQISTPNANYHDLLAFYLNFRQKGQLPKILLIAVVYDDLKEIHIHENAISTLKPIDPNLIVQYGDGIRNINERFEEWKSKLNENAPIERTTTSDTPQEFLEKRLITWLEKVWHGYRFRGTLASFINAKIVVTIDNLLRQDIIKRKIKVRDYQKAWSNMALESLIKLTHDDNVNLVLYKQPQRSKIYFDVRYDRTDFDSYFDWIKSKSVNDHVYYCDLENIVPDEEFGFGNGGLPDIFHFKNMGHRLLGTSIDEYISNNFKDGNNVIQ